MTAAELEALDGGYASLLRAAELTRAGTPVEVVEPNLRAGAPYLTESFLTPFRFNLGPTLVPRPPVASLRLLEPDPLLAVGDAVLERAPRRLEASGTVWQTLERSGAPAGEQAVLAALAVLLGLDPDRDGSGAELAAAASRPDELVAVEGGNGLVAAALVDEIVAGGGRVVEGVGTPVARDAPESGAIGICRLFVGLRKPPPTQRAFAEAHGFADVPSLRSRLAELRAGRADGPVGFLVANAHLDPRRPGDALGSFAWQGLLPASAGTPARAEHAAAILELLRVAEADVLFSLLWLPSETGERLR